MPSVSEDNFNQVNMSTKTMPEDKTTLTKTKTTMMMTTKIKTTMIMTTKTIKTKHDNDNKDNYDFNLAILNLKFLMM